tara:strand:+ start:734 stop:1753 length:1020 start_codon:yes stop_codon:yes gene_type:complete
MRYFFINLLLSIFFILPNWFLRTFWSLKRQKIRNQYLDYQAAAFLRIIDFFGYKIDTENFSNIERSRANLSRLKIRINENTANRYSVKDHSFDHAENVSIREYTPNEILSDKAMLYFHGGGYVLGSVDTHHNFVSFMAIELGIRIYSLEYRLAPENKFPDALNDAHIAFQWLKNKGYKEKQIMLCGDSAGGHLAASLTNHLDAMENELPYSQILIYPMTCPSLKFESMELFKENYLLTKAAMNWFWEQLRHNQENNQDPRFNLLKQINKTNFQIKTSVITAGFDPLCDEGKDYAKHLKSQGNEVSQVHYPDLFHGFVTFTRLRQAKSATLGIIEEIRGL